MPIGCGKPAKMNFRVGPFSRVRIIPNPEERLRTLVGRAPEAEEWADRTMARLHPTLAMLHSIRRRVATAAVAAFTVWLFMHVMFGANGMVVYRQKRTEYLGLQKQIQGLEQENGRFTGEIKALKTDPETIEKEAREQLHYARPGEIIYVSPPPPPPPQKPDTRSAQK